MKLVSRVAACVHPGTDAALPGVGLEFEIDAERGAELIAAGLAEEAKNKKKKERDNGES